MASSSRAMTTSRRDVIRTIPLPDSEPAEFGDEYAGSDMSDREEQREKSEKIKT